jgi:cell division protein FtsZ
MLVENTETALRPKIIVFGVGGAGGNAVNNMIASDLKGVTFIVANTDAQALENAMTDHKVQLGMRTTRGLGAGALPKVGEASAEESAKEIRNYLDGVNLVFITAGMGGGTGTGAAPVIAKIAKEMGILTVGVVTKPFLFEGAHRMALAEEGLRKMRENVDTLIIVANQNLFRIANERTTFMDAFKIADNVLRDGVCGIVELIIMDGLVNLDLADISTIMKDGGPAMMGTGSCSDDENRSIIAAERAISNPLLDRISIGGASKVLINITGGMDMTLFEVDAAANRIRDEINNPNANIIFGSTFKQDLEGSIVVSVFATGLEEKTNIATVVHKKPQNEEEVHHEPKVSVEATKKQVSSTFSAQQQLEIHNVIKPKEVERNSVQSDIYDIPAFLRKIKNNNEE